jgi:DNA end-binding protein Ku
MPRATWSGAISFGLVNIPIKLYTAVSRKNVTFNQIDTRTNSRVKQKRISEADGTEVPYDAMAKGYQLPGGDYVIVTEDELAALDPEASRTVEIEEFVDLVDIDPVFYDSAYVVAPDKAMVKPYALLTRAMEDSGKVGIARFVMRTKQYLAAVRPVDGMLMMSTMVYADEVNDPAAIDELAGLDGVEVSERELAMATQLIESLSTKWEPEKFGDTHRERVLDLIEQKASGAEDITVAPAAESPEKVVDLMAALEASVAAAKNARKRHPTARTASTSDSDGKADEAEAEVADEAVAASGGAPAKGRANVGSTKAAKATRAAKAKATADAEEAEETAARKPTRRKRSA